MELQVLAKYGKLKFNIFTYKIDLLPLTNLFLNQIFKMNKYWILIFYFMNMSYTTNKLF